MLSIKSYSKIVIALAVGFISLPSFAQMETAPESAALSVNSNALGSLEIVIPTGLVTPDWNTFLKLGIEQIDSKRLRDILPISFPAAADPKKALMAVFQQDPDAFSIAVSYLARKNIDPKAGSQNGKLDTQALNAFRRALIIQADFIDSWQKELLERFSRLHQDTINDPRSYRTLVELHLCIDQSNRLFRGLDIFLHPDTIRELGTAQASAKEAANRITILRAVMPDETMTSGGTLTDGIRTEVLPLSIADSIKLLHSGSFNYTYTQPERKIGYLDTGFTLPADFSKIYSQLKSPQDDLVPSNSYIIDHTGDSDQTSWRFQGLPPVLATKNPIAYNPSIRLNASLFLSAYLNVLNSTRFYQLKFHPTSFSFKPIELESFLIRMVVRDIMFWNKTEDPTLEEYLHPKEVKPIKIHGKEVTRSNFPFLAWLYNSIQLNRLQAMMILLGGLIIAFLFSGLPMDPYHLMPSSQSFWNALGIIGSALYLMIPYVKKIFLEEIIRKIKVKISLL